MSKYLLKILYLLIFSTLTIITYFWYQNHIFSYTNSLFLYILVVIIFFVLYYYLKHNNSKIKYSIIEIVWYFLLNLLFLSFFIFTSNWSSLFLWFTLFFKIIGFLILPILLVIISYSFWYFLINKIKNISDETTTFKFLLSLWIWFFSFVMLISISWYLGFYNLYVLFSIVALFIAFSHKELVKIIKNVYLLRFEIEWHDFSKKYFNLNLFTREIAFFIIIFIIWINFINIVRPMPVWWDDLWVYMNFPKILASYWELKNLWWMMSWQIFTWIWFLFWSATQAFFLNNVWGVLSVICLVLIFWDLLKSVKKTFINIPFVLTSIFISMPMIVFQQAKDMKLDPGLFFITIISVYILFYVFWKYLWYQRELKSKNFELIENVTPDSYSIEVKNNSNFNNFLSYFKKYQSFWNRDMFENKSYLIYIFIAWILAWFAFSIKLTSLLLISWSIWLIFYSKLWLSWFLWYISLYFWIFTKFNLWSMLNISYPKDNVNLLNFFVIICLIISLLLFIYSIHKYTFNVFKKLLIILGVYLIWVILSLTSNILYNYSTLDKLSISWLINWQNVSYKPNLDLIYSKSEKELLNKKYLSTTTTSSWVTQNEDFWRYFWYEQWLNNYVKLPYNLTMQTNQTWEFTDITFLFFAFIPLILFLSYKWVVWISIASIFSIFPLIYFLPKDNFIYSSFTDILSSFSLPFWYIILFLIFFLVPFLFFLFWLNKEKFSMLFKINLVFTLFYVFLWTISAFWIVWYWIGMYFNLLLFIWIGLFYLSNYDNKTSQKEYKVKFFGSISVLFIIFIYYLLSVIPQAYQNLTQAWFMTYKSGQETAIKTIFLSQNYYFNTLVELNISPDKRDDLYNLTLSKVSSSWILNLIKENNIKTVNELHDILYEIYNSKIDKTIKSEVSNALDFLYNQVYSPKNEFKNDSKIYRIWTFYRYFVDDSVARMLEDWLLFFYDRYIYDKNNLNLTVDRLKKLWVNYLLIDLNAATIDKDSRKDLTRRYENILHTFTSDKLQLVNTDSICLKIALENYSNSKKTKKDIDDFKVMAWVNYESYDDDWKQISRWDKLLNCFSFINQKVTLNEISETKYNYLLPIYNYIIKNNLQIKETDSNEVIEKKTYDSFMIYKNYYWKSFFTLFKIKN